ncbi:MAG: PilT/PilU family type 4a pilus ATPase [Verrucomicrobiales bacterium]|jgi:twitching motility protein PilT|nr:PilT/PilU family type 4a pilus ATPase [Verrucomicrobiales bacterium]
MNTSAYNDYVLNASLQTHWITEEQKQLIEAALRRLPGAAALDLMLEQSVLNAEQGDMLKNLIAQAEAQPAVQPASAPAPAPWQIPSVSVVETAPAPDPDAPVEGLPYGIHGFLQAAVGMGTSDIHLSPEAPVLVRYHGQLMPLNTALPNLSAVQTEALARQFLTADQQKLVEERGSIEFSYSHEGVGRFRSSVVRQRRGWEAVFRVIEHRIRSMKELGFPPVMYELIKYHNGLILVTGAVGCGKTTTLAAMVQEINQDRKDHIITLEDPIEYVFTSAGCRLTQREIHTHTESYSSALRTALRQDPDVIMVGEMRDLETISLAITASETGHLVLATLHTSNAARTMQRLLDVFPVEQQAQIRTMVSESLRGVLCQQLIPRADGKGRVMAMEIMTNKPAIGALIREGKNFMLPGQIQISHKDGMVLMDDSLLELVKQNLITPEEAFNRCEDRKTFAGQLAGRMKRK